MSNLMSHELDHHRRFRVTIIETLKRTVEVNADDSHDAQQMVSDGWHSSKYILGSEDFVGVEFDAVLVTDEK